jgi:hypothetical protein
MCPQCDEAFQPQFYRVCPACGCDAEEGLQVEQVHAYGQDGQLPRMALGLAALLCLLSLWLWWLWHGA